MTDLKSAFVGATGDVVEEGDQHRLFAVSVARTADDGNCNLIFKSGGSSGTEVLQFELGVGTEPFMFVVPGGNSIRFDDGIHVTFEGGATNPASITVLYQ